MELFSIIEDAFVVLYSKGVYRQATVFERAGKQYAKWGGGFVRILRGGLTTVPTVKWSDPQGFEVRI